MPATEPVIPIIQDQIRRPFQLFEYIPAAGTLSNGEDLPAAAFFITQINLDTFDDSTPIMVCPHKCKHEDCDHFGEHEADNHCDKNCFVFGIEGGCHMAEFTPVDDIGDEEEIG